MGWVFIGNVLERFDLSGSTSSREPRSTAANNTDRGSFGGRCRGVLIVSLLLPLVSDTLDSEESDTAVMAPAQRSEAREGRGPEKVERKGREVFLF